MSEGDGITYIVDCSVGDILVLIQQTTSQYFGEIKNDFFFKERASL